MPNIPTAPVRWISCLTLAVACTVSGAGAVMAQQSAAATAAADQWPFVGGDGHNTRYSALTDLTPENVGDLEVAWTWRPEERAMPEFGTTPGSFTSTPLMIDGVLYVSTNYNRVAALDAETGAVLWIFDPKAYELGMPALGGGFRHRGVTAWRDGDELRIFLGSRYRLYSIDAATGQLVSSFGDDGVVDTAKDLSWEVNRAHFEINAPPAIYGDIVIVGSAIGDRLLYEKAPPGDVRAYHARTGELVWTWSPIPQSPDDFGADTWENESWRHAGQIEVWPGVTVDQERGLVFAPTGNPANLYYGGSRPGDNLFAETLVALDAQTGRRVWHYQLVHHGLWDYSLPAQSILASLEVEGEEIPAVIQLTKHGYVYTFNRETGEPVWPIEELPVPASDVPGEQASLTQPVPTRPPHVLPVTGVSLDDAFDLTPELQAEAREVLSQYRLGPIYTPPSLQGSVIRPSAGGAVSWGGGAFDSETGMLYVKVSDQPGILGMAKFDPTADNPFANPEHADWIGYDVYNVGTTFRGGIPLTKPPYAWLAAFDMNRGELVWRVPFGRGSDALREHEALQDVELPDRLGTPGPPGSIVTAGGLVFVGGGDEAIFAFDKTTGEEVWMHDIGRRTSGIPMTYRGASGRQFVVITTGAGDDQEMVAFAVPDRR